MNHKRHFKALNAHLVACVFLSLTACENSHYMPREISKDILSSCLVTPNIDLGVSVGQFVDLMKSKGGSIVWENDGDNHILRSSLTDRLTGETQSFDIEIVVRPATKSEKSTPNCGPDRAVVSRALLTADGLVEGYDLEFLMEGVTRPIASNPLGKVQVRPPVAVQGNPPSLDDLGN